MNNKVTIIPDEAGNVIRQSKNSPEYGFVRVVQETVQFGLTGWVNAKTRSTLILGKLEELKSIGIADMKTLPGKIVVKESTEPFNSSDPDRDLKIAGETGIICCTADGEPIYRRSFYDPTNQQEDEFVAHANGDAIREANKSSNGASMIANQEFNIEKSSSKQVDLVDSIEEIESKDTEDVEEDSVLDEIELETNDGFEV
jgi:hypothetical protein